MRNKLISTILSLIMLIVCIMSMALFSGCVIIDGGYYMSGYLPEYESGYFRYAIEKYTNTKTHEKKKRVHIIGLTESGLQQVGLVFPDEIDGIPVDGIAYYLAPVSMWGAHKRVGDLSSENLEKMFFLDSPRENVAMELSSNVFTVYWKLDVRFSNVHYGDTISIIGYDYYMEKIHKPYQYECKNRIANVTYMYNYEGSPNKGCYWVDSYDESIITFIPPIPEREGYKFAGWYKDEDCKDEWDFERDITGKEVIIGGYTVYDKEYEGIYLYAKWIKV